MKESPILFNAEMVRAILDGRKTQTRRVIKQAKNPHDFLGGVNEDRDDPYNYGFENPDVMGHFCTLPEQRCPYGSVGDILWVRETFCHNGEKWLYKANYGEDQASAITWKPSIHMPRAACRLMLKITGIRAERLHKISEDDAGAEGCPIPQILRKQYVDRDDTAYGWFRGLWKSINGVESWDRNPFVWVIDFRRN